MPSVRKPKNKDNKSPQATRTVSLNPAVFHRSRAKPEALKRDISTPAQRNYSEETLIYGEDDALPLRIALAVKESPSATSCLKTVSQFIKGSGFSDDELMKLPIDGAGNTLWDLHCSLADIMALFWGFAVNFKFDNEGKILSVYITPFESCRFVEPGEYSNEITTIKYNPYFGTNLYKKEYTKEYTVFNPKEAIKEVSKLTGDQRKAYGGQIYYYGKTSPLSRFYPEPDYWSAKEAIQADHKLQEFVNEELENGFFQSVLINAIGDPNQWSSNPKYQKEVTQTDGTTKKKQATKTVGEEFNEEMGEAFSGSRKAGTALVLWSKNANDAIKVTAFPTTINSERLTGTQDSIIKIITIATGVPSILANISEGVSLGSGGSEIQKAVELMQSRTLEFRNTLQNFYNTVLFPNMQKPPKGTVEIQNFNPITEPIEVNKDIWAFLNEQEKIAFIQKNMPEIEIIRAPVPAAPAPTTSEEGTTIESVPATDATQINESLKTLKIADINKIQKIVARFNLGNNNPEDPKALTYDQAKQILSSYGFTDEQIDAWLVKPEEIEV